MGPVNQPVYLRHVRHRCSANIAASITSSSTGTSNHARSPVSSRKWTIPLRQSHQPATVTPLVSTTVMAA